jgi:hypothetical protein
LCEGGVDRLIDDLPSLGIARTKFGFSPVPGRFEILDPRLGSVRFPVLTIASVSAAMVRKVETSPRE